MTTERVSATVDPRLLGGTWYLVPTPFDDAGELDRESLAALVDAALAWGVDGLTVMGVMSEPAALAGWERTAALRAIFDAVRGRVPVVAGCSAASPELALALIAEARELGAAAAMVAAPTLLKNVDLLPAFFGRLAREGGLPLVLQDEPAATGVPIPVSVLLAGAAASGAPCVKVEDPPTPPKIARLKAGNPSLALFGGLGGMFALTELERGASGTMTGFAYPEVMRAVRERLEAGRRSEAAALFDRFLPLIVFEAQAVVGLLVRKELLRRRGAIRSARTRGLVDRIDGTTARELDDVLERVGITPSLDALVLPGAGSVS